MLSEGLIPVNGTASVVGDMSRDMRSPAICTFWTSFFFVWTVFVRMSFTTHNTFRFFVQFSASCPKPWHFKHCWIEGVVLNSSTLKIMPVFWHTNLPEMIASACFVSLHLILIKGRSLPDLLYFIRSASALVILLKSSSSLKSSIFTLFDTPLKTKTSLLWRLQNDKTLVITPLRFSQKLVAF